MKKNISDYIVALFVIACSVVLLGALTFALSGYRFKQPTRTLQIKYQDITGIKIHSEVRYAGAPAGRVIAIRPLTPAERQSSSNKKDCVLITISLNDDIPPLPSDITATLSSDSMLSPKFVALSAGTAGGKTLPNHSVIEGKPAYGIDQITAAAGPLFDNANKLLDNLNVTVTDLKGDLGDFMPKLGPLADSLKSDVDDLQSVIKGLSKTEDQAGAFFSTTDTFIGKTDKSLQAQMRELHVILLNLKVISTHAKALVDELAEKPNRVIFSGKPPQLTPESEIIKSNKPLPAKKP
jgi:ABC-type transporter Mla subunit MlaD